MRNFFFAIITVLTFSNCTNNSQNNDILPFISVNETVDLSLPNYINLQAPGGWAYAPGGLKGIIIYNKGRDFKAFERAAPHLPISDCSQMIVKNNLRMKCSCDDSEFSMLNGSPLTSGVTHFAREYLVTKLNETILRITNF